MHLGSIKNPIFRKKDEDCCEYYVSVYKQSVASTHMFKMFHSQESPDEESNNIIRVFEQSKTYTIKFQLQERASGWKYCPTA